MLLHLIFIFSNPPSLIITFECFSRTSSKCTATINNQRGFLLLTEGQREDEKPEAIPGAHVESSPPCSACPVPESDILNGTLW